MWTHFQNVVRNVAFRPVILPVEHGSVLRVVIGSIDCESRIK